MFDQLSNIKTPKEIRKEATLKMEILQNKNKENLLSQKLLFTIKSKTLANLENTQSTVEYKINEENDQTIKGIASFNVLYLYSDETNGFAIYKYDFILTKNTDKIEINLIPEFLNYDYSTGLESEITEQEKKDVEIKKQNYSITNNYKIKTIDSIKKESNMSAKENFRKIRENLQLKYNCQSIKVNANNNPDYQGINARDYARQYAVNYNSNYFDYNDYGGDCTNFTSQAVYAGGLIKDYGSNSSSDRDWYFHWDYPWYGGRSPVSSTTWIRVTDQMNHMYYRENTSTWLDFSVSGYDIFNPMQIGDLLYADWDGNGLWDHSMVITGWNIINGHFEPKLTYHTTDRDNITFAELRQGNPNAKFKGF